MIIEPNHFEMNVGVRNYNNNYNRSDYSIIIFFLSSTRLFHLCLWFVTTSYRLFAMGAKMLETTTAPSVCTGTLQGVDQVTADVVLLFMQNKILRSIIVRRVRMNVCGWLQQTVLLIVYVTNKITSTSRRY